MSINSPTPQEEFNRAVAASNKNFTYEQAKGGHYRLLCDDDIILDDPACEDLYDLDSALYTFIEYIFENYPDLQRNGHYLEINLSRKQIDISCQNKH